MDNSEFAKALKEARKNKGLTQKSLAEKVGTTQQTIAQYEKGAMLPKAELLGQIVKVLAIDPEEIPSDYAYLLDAKGVDVINPYREALLALKSVSTGEDTLLKDYRKLNPTGQTEAQKRVHELTEIPRYKKD